MSTPPVVTRFAPSPTGALHIGGARTALFAWAFARKHKGTFILRVEDTDQRRSSKDSAAGIIRDLQWLGIDWDEGPMPAPGDLGGHDHQQGANGPYFQSQRLDIYNHHIEALLKANFAYEDQGAVRFRMGKDVTHEDAVFGTISVPGKDLEDFVIRKADGFPTFHMAVVVDDALMGTTHVLRGAEHLPNTPKHAALYDALAQTMPHPEKYKRPVWTHMPSIMNPGGSKMSKRDKAKVAREAISFLAKQKSNTPEQVIEELITRWVTDLLEQHAIPIQKYRWSLNNPTPSEQDIARRDQAITTSAQETIDETRRDVIAFYKKENDNKEIAEFIADGLEISLPEIEVLDFAKSGYLPAAILNYIALLGWNPKTEVERFDLPEFIERFSVEMIHKSNSTFDREKLFRFNAERIAALPADVFAGKMAELAPGDFAPLKADAARWALFCKAYQPRARTLSEPFRIGRFFVASPAWNFADKSVAKAGFAPGGEAAKWVETMHTAFAALPETGFGKGAHDWISAQAQTNPAVGMGKWAGALRVAVSGGTTTPDIEATLDILGKTETLKRMAECLKTTPR